MIMFFCIQGNSSQTIYKEMSVLYMKEFQSYDIVKRCRIELNCGYRSSQDYPREGHQKLYNQLQCQKWSN